MGIENVRTTNNKRKILAHTPLLSRSREGESGRIGGGGNFPTRAPKRSELADGGGGGASNDGAGRASSTTGHIYGQQITTTLKVVKEGTDRQTRPKENATNMQISWMRTASRHRGCVNGRTSISSCNEGEHSHIYLCMQCSLRAQALTSVVRMRSTE